MNLQQRQQDCALLIEQVKNLETKFKDLDFLQLEFEPQPDNFKTLVQCCFNLLDQIEAFLEIPRDEEDNT